MLRVEARNDESEGDTLTIGGPHRTPGVGWPEESGSKSHTARNSRHAGQMLLDQFVLAQERHPLNLIQPAIVT